MGNESVIGHDPACIPGEEGHDFKLHLGKMDRFPLHRHQTPVKINNQPLGL